MVRRKKYQENQEEQKETNTNKSIMNQRAVRTNENAQNFEKKNNFMFLPTLISSSPCV